MVARALSGARVFKKLLQSINRAWRERGVKDLGMALIAVTVALWTSTVFTADQSPRLRLFGIFLRENSSSIFFLTIPLLSAAVGVVIVIRQLIEYLDSGKVGPRSANIERELSSVLIDDWLKLKHPGADAATDELLKYLRKQSAKNEGDIAAKAPLPSPGEQIVARLVAEVGAQSRRATLNLLMGVVAAAIAIGFLVWLAASAVSSASEAPTKIETSAMPYLFAKYWGAFAAKMALSSGASLFAFFFLSTYRRNLSEIRYFHNELTNVQSRMYAVDMCKGDHADVTLLRILENVAATERNFILRKGETTIDLAQKDLDRAEDDSLKVALKTLADAANRMVGKSDEGSKD
ncbi:hypothetical protein [Caulobacter sp. UNC279MFTsu5.1]|uniref:hypothetical protein n=1 Tax=Caulobacter sp. UNC279MFTsu5.1 TaxID=1502775 RepID=UPI0008E04BEF|nr:hypothetical protein [Caulobacter sp. UNC279MFTsu5.1]SFK41571.1 hypothetical protein SAMN02799626_04233 [Caulobacter sp. UNC279MFTsu5.1]